MPPVRPAQDLPPIRPNGAAAREPQAPVMHKPLGEPAAGDRKPVRAEPVPLANRGAVGSAPGVERRVPVPRKDLLSPAVDAAVAAAFKSLGDLVLPQQERTVEDLVKEILRPMLKEWLDQNLPGIVERLVRAEIERVTSTLR